MINLAAVRTVLFDFGGVLATEGFQQGLFAIARNHGLDFHDFFTVATETMYGCGYITNDNNEAGYWRGMREQTGITGSGDAQLTREILDRFHLRPAMMAAVQALKKNAVTCAILSDQTDWLDRLEKRLCFFHEFHLVCNSFHTKITKRDPLAFSNAARLLCNIPDEILFVDDNPANTTLAASLGFQVHHFTEEKRFLAVIAPLCVASGR